MQSIFELIFLLLLNHNLWKRLLSVVKVFANRQLLLLLAFCELAPAFFRQRSRYSSVEFLSLSLKNEGKKKKRFVAENEVI